MPCRRKFDTELDGVRNEKTLLSMATVMEIRTRDWYFNSDGPTAGRKAPEGNLRRHVKTQTAFDVKAEQKKGNVFAIVSCLMRRFPKPKESGVTVQNRRKRLI